VIPLKEKLNVKQEKFVQNIVSGMSQRQAYKDAFKVDYDENAIDSNASTLFKQAKIQQRYKELIEELKEATIMTAKERMIWLSEVVQGIQKEKEAVFTDGDVVIKDVEANLNTKIKALDTLNKMSGEYVTKVEGNIGVTKLEDLL
jgi:phage terminase small subunit